MSYGSNRVSPIDQGLFCDARIELNSPSTKSQGREGARLFLGLMLLCITIGQ